MFWTPNFSENWTSRPAPGRGEGQLPKSAVLLMENAGLHRKHNKTIRFFLHFWARTGLPRAFSLSFHSLSFSSLSFVALQLKPALCMVWAPPIKSCIFRNIAADGRPSRAKLVRGQARPGMVPTGEHTNADLDLEPVKRSATPTMARSCPHCSACHDGSTAPCVDLNAEPLPRLAASGSRAVPGRAETSPDGDIP